MSSSSWILKWNSTPHEYREQATERLQALQPGAEVAWPCSENLQPDDRVYVLRMGPERQGLYASGHVIEAPHHALNPNERTVHFRVDQVHADCANGFVPLVLLQQWFADQDWVTLQDCAPLKEPLAGPLETLWQQAQGQHILATYAAYADADRGNGHKKWLARYEELTHRVAQVRSGEHELSESLLAELWEWSQNGVTGVAPGHLYNAEFQSGKALLFEFTKKILHSPDEQTLNEVYQDWANAKQRGIFSRTLHSVIHRVFAAVAPQHYSSLLNRQDLISLLKGMAKYFELRCNLDQNWAGLNRALKAFMRDAGLDPSHEIKNNVAMWELYELFDHARPLAALPLPQDQCMKGHNTMQASSIPLNQILFGPPGTGKTYHSINAALEILDPDFLRDHGEPEQRSALKKRFETLMKAGQIVFCTFHQSFSYEDFIQGIRAETQDGQLTYSVHNGVFKQLCDRARIGVIAQNDVLDKAIHQLKKTLAELELADADTDGVYGLEMRTRTGKAFRVRPSRDHTLLVFPSNSTSPKTQARIMLKDLRDFYAQNPTGRLIAGETYLWGVLDYLKRHCHLPVYDPKLPAQKAADKFVMIIDEINRGNVSRIFGELITLIEPSKREGADEALSAELPYADEDEPRFSVPSNVYLIGTMNTADRSLAGMDIALRRRFVFKEMPPNTALLSGHRVGDIDLGDLLSIMNQRIEALLGREHCLGHAYFMPLLDPDLSDSEARFKLLSIVFQNQILPLLQEYFFEDWQRIQWVLNDHRKPNADRFVYQVTRLNTDLFGAQIDQALDNRPWRINEDAFTRHSAFAGIIEVRQVAPEGATPS
ncbi:AAA family ATPase [Pseudomonas fluorescens]|nr:AAA family ATPase [Pseudomonas fluorescens]